MRFAYGDKVIINKGFFKGRKGVVLEKFQFIKYIQYRIDFDDGNNDGNWVDHKLLSPNTKETIQ